MRDMHVASAFVVCIIMGLYRASIALPSRDLAALPPFGAFEPTKSLGRRPHRLKSNQGDGAPWMETAFSPGPRGSWARGTLQIKTTTPRPTLRPPLRLPGLPAGTDSTAIYRRGGGGVGARRAGSGTGRRPQLLGGCAPKPVQPHGAVYGGTGIGPRPL